MFLFVGLGNPGYEYHNTRHNIGFMSIDLIFNYFIEQNIAISDFIFNKKFNADITDIKLTLNSKTETFLLLKPQTYMNLSGKAVLSVMNFYKIPITNIFIFYDDADLKLGKIQIVKNKNSAGHNGIKSINEYININYTKIRIGIGRPEKEHNQDLSNFVLSKFNENEINLIERNFTIIIEELKRLLTI